MDEFLKKLKTPVSELWAKNKMFLILAGVLILIIKFQDVIFDYLVNRSKKMVDEAEKKSGQLMDEQNKANDKANELRQEANDLGNNRPDVDENWHKKK